jgi:hypothetical protein
VTVDAAPVRPAATLLPSHEREVSGGFVSIDGERYARIENVDAMRPFLMSVASDSDVWLFVGSHGAFTAGRRDPDHAVFPFQTADKILRDANSGGVRSAFLVSRGDSVTLWEPWIGPGGTRSVTRNLYKRIDGTAVVFEEIESDLGLRFRWSLSACEPFGLVRHAVVEEIAAEPVDIRYLDGWHQLIPAGVGRDLYAQLSYLAIGYMRHELLEGSPLALYTLNTMVSDRPEPTESLRVATAWAIGHRDPVILLGDAQVDAFRRGGAVEGGSEVRGEMGAYLAVDRVSLEPGGSHDWFIVADTGLDHRSALRLSEALRPSGGMRATLASAVAADRRGVQQRVAGADGIQVSADEAATANHASNVLFNVMRGGTFEHGYEVPRDDLQSYLQDQSLGVAERHRRWLEQLPEHTWFDDLLLAADAHDDPQLSRLLRGYLPLTFSRRHGDPSRPWNWYSIRVHDEDGDPVYGYEGNWRDIFQNWEALGISYPGYLLRFITVFLNASTADGYNPYRITRAGVDWEIEDPDDPWSHIGYWGDHQITYLLRLLEAYEHHDPGALRARLDERLYSYADVPYRIGDFDSIAADPRHTIVFDGARHQALVEAGRRSGADGRLVHDTDGEVRLVTLGEKLLLPLLVKLTNLVPGSGIWLNTQRPEWNDANNALAGWGVSVVTLSAMVRHARFLHAVFAGDGEVDLSASVQRLLEDLIEALGTAELPEDDVARYAAMARLGRAGQTHRQAVYAGAFGEPVSTPRASICSLLDSAGQLLESTIRASRRPDGLYHSYDVLRIDGRRASVRHLGLMLEGQVAVLDSGLLDDDDAIELLRALRASALYRADQHSYLLYPDRPSVPFLERNTIQETPPLADPSLFVAGHDGAWHFQADLSTLADVDRRLEAINAEPHVRDAVRDLWRTTFGHEEFTGRSDRFFMFEGLGSIYWHMVAKLALAVQRCYEQAHDPAAAATLATIYHDIRDGLGFNKSPDVHGAFPIDPYSHTPQHLGAQQPGMTGQVKEQILTRFGELGVHVQDGRIDFVPRLVPRSELLASSVRARFIGHAGATTTVELPPGSLAFSYCGVPIVYREGDIAAIELEHMDGHREVVVGAQLDRQTSLAIFQRRAPYRHLTVVVPRGSFHE